MQMFKSIHRKLDLLTGGMGVLYQRETTILTKIDDLNAAVGGLAANVTALSNSVTANDAAVQTEIDALKAAIAAGDTTGIDASIARISELSAAVGAQATSVAAETATLAASLPQATPPATPPDGSTPSTATPTPTPLASTEQPQS